MSKTLNFMAPSSQGGQLPFTLLDDEIPPESYRAVQNWALCFLTKRGTRKVDPDYGTDFMTNLQSGRLISRADVISAFNDANSVCIGYCLDSTGQLYVTNAFLTKLIVDESDSGKFLVIYIAFVFSDGTVTRTFIEVA